MSRREKTTRDLFIDRRGALATEYVLLVGVVTLGVFLEIIYVGPRYVNNYERTRNALMVPVP